MHEYKLFLLYAYVTMLFFCLFFLHCVRKMHPLDNNNDKLISGRVSMDKKYCI